MPLPIRLAFDVTTDDLHLLRVVAAEGGADAPLLVRVEAGLALPLWRAPETAAAAAVRAPTARPARIAGRDLRAKEELLRDSLELGAALVLHDPRPGPEGALEPAGVDLVQRALNEILAERRASACL